MANITKVYLLSVPLEDDYKDTLYFANATAQQTYFAGQVVKSYTDFSYQRKGNVIRVPAQVDTIRNCNYVMYQNTAYSNKWLKDRPALLQNPNILLAVSVEILFSLCACPIN